MSEEAKYIMKNKVVPYIEIIIGAAIMAVAIGIFLVPNQLSSGGFAGIATILYYLLQWPMGVTIVVLNIPIFIIAYFKIGKEFLAKALIGTISLSIFVDLINQAPTIIEDKFLACIFGGILDGIGTALVLRGRGSTGGSDLLANVIRAFKPGLRTGTLIILIDIIIVTLNVIAFKTIEVGLYSAIVIYILGKMIDIVFEGTNFAKQLFIISDEYEMIAKKIKEEIGRGVTGIYGKGMYKNNEKTVLLCVASRTEAIKIMNIAKEIDKGVFIIVSNAREVLGLGFK